MSSQEWIEHKGGPCPVAADALVDVMLLCDDVRAGRRADHWAWAWTNHPIAYDIIAYRLASPPAAVDECEHKAAMGDDLAIYDRIASSYKGARLARDMTVRERMALDILCAVRGKTGVNWRVAISNAVEEADALIAALKEGSDE